MSIAHIMMDGMDYMNDMYGRLVGVLDTNFDFLAGVVNGLTVALLTILIPFAIAALTDHFNRAADESARFGKLNLHILLDRVFSVKDLITFTIVIFASSLMKLIPWSPIVLVYLVVVAIYLYSLIRIILKVYEWYKLSKHKFQIEYLDDRKVQTNDLVESFQSVWATGDINYWHEREFFDVFSRGVDQYIKGESIGFNLVTQLISDWSSHIEKRDPVFLQRKEPFRQFLTWHEQVFREYGDTVSEVDELIWVVEDTIGRLLDFLIKSEATPAFMNAAEEITDEHKENTLYLQRFLSLFLSGLFRSLQEIDNEKASYRRFMVLKQFPDAWRMRSSEINTSKIQQIVYENFHEWGHNQVWDDATRRKYPFFFDTVVKYIFPDVDPILWGRFFEFAWSPWGDSRIESFIEKDWKLGLIGRTYSGTESIRETRREQIEETLELVRLKLGFEKSEVENYINEANRLESVYDGDREKQRKREQVQGMFELLLEHMNLQA